MKNISYLIFQLMVAILTLSACSRNSGKQNEEQIWMVVQPQLELNRTTTAKVFFKDRPDTGSISIKVIESENEADYDLDGKQIARDLESDGKNYYYAIEFTAGRPGKAFLPVIEAKIAGKSYKSKPVSIEVLKKQVVDSSAIKLVLSADHATYQYGDTINIALTEYTKFTEIARFTPADLVKKGAPEALFAVIDEGNVDYKVGIMGFKSYIDANFKVASFDWNVNRLNQSMSILDRNIYVQTPLFQMKAIAKKKGKFTINSSRFDYKIYPYSEAFREELSSPGDVLQSNNRFTVQSNKLEIAIK